MKKLLDFNNNMMMRNRKTKHDYDIELISQLLTEGWHINEIEKEFGISNGTLGHHLKKNYIKKIILLPKPKAFLDRK